MVRLPGPLGYYAPVAPWLAGSAAVSGAGRPRGLGRWPAWGLPRPLNDKRRAGGYLTALVTGYTCSIHLDPGLLTFRYLYMATMVSMVYMATYQVTMTVDAETREYLEEEAERQHRSMSYVARKMVHESLPEDVEPGEVHP